MANLALDGLANCDDSFGPAASNCSSPRFDFSLKFEQSILTIAPCTLFVICALLRIVQLLRESPKVIRLSLGHLKLVRHDPDFQLSILQIIGLVNCRLSTSHLSRYSWPWSFFGPRPTRWPTPSQS
ncbi:hypothetical protein GGI43DRAFT_114 [Trichoderma evansii]